MFGLDPYCVTLVIVLKDCLKAFENICRKNSMQKYPAYREDKKLLLSQSTYLYNNPVIFNYHICLVKMYFL